MTAEQKSRRDVLKYAGVAIGGLVVGGAAGWLAKPTPMVTPLVTPNATVTTVTQTASSAAAKFGTAPAAGTPITIVHGFDAAYPPFTQVTTSGQVVGFDVDVLGIIAKNNGWTVVEKPWQWASIITALENGDLDVVMSGLTMLASRADVISFSLPYYPVYHEIVALATNKQTLNQILNSGGFISVETGSAADQWATKLLAAGMKFSKLGLDTYELALEAVGDGRAVGSLTDSSWLNPLLAKNPTMAAEYKIVGMIGGFSTYGVGTRNGDSWLRGMINHGLEDLMGTTQWDDLESKWGLS